MWRSKCSSGRLLALNSEPRCSSSKLRVREHAVNTQCLNSMCIKREQMRQSSFVIVALLVISLGAVAQENAPKPKVSDAPLTSEQITVYRAVLADYLNGSDGVLNLASVTEPLEASDIDCLRGIDAGVTKESASVVHKLGPPLVANTRIVLVDPDRQHKTIKENDPENLMRKTIEGHQKITDEQLDQSVETAFASGLFTLSEIAFDKEHHRAVLSYSFVCGGLCGHGNMLVLKKVGHSWKVAKRCGGWVSQVNCEGAGESRSPMFMKT